MKLSLAVLVAVLFVAMALLAEHSSAEEAQESEVAQFFSNLQTQMKDVGEQVSTAFRNLHESETATQARTTVVDWWTKFVEKFKGNAAK